MLPLRCNTFTTFNLEKDDNNLVFKIAHDLRLQADGNGIFVINGEVVANGKSSSVNRVINLSNGIVLDEDTVEYQIKSVSVSPTDNTSSSDFNKLIAEFTSDPKRFELDIINVDDDAYLIGGPVSFLFICMRY